MADTTAATETEETTDPTETVMGKIGSMLGTEMRTLRDTIETLEARATELETKAATLPPKPNAEFFRYAPRLSLGPTIKAKAGEVALSAHVRCAGKDYYFHIESFMGYVIEKICPTVMVSATQKIVIGDLGRVMAYGQFIDTSGTYTHAYDLGNVFIQLCAKAAANLPGADDQTCYQTSMPSPPRAEHPIVRSEGGTTVTVASSAQGFTPLYAALRGNPTEGSTAMDRTTNGKWGADLMKCWIEMQGVDEAGTGGYNLYQAWRAYMLKVCQAADPTFALVFSNRAGTPRTALTGAPAHF